MINFRLRQLMTLFKNELINEFSNCQTVSPLYCTNFINSYNIDD